jgi:hypothetical protein
MVVQLSLMPLTVFDMKGIPGHRRERIEAAVVAGGRHVSGPQRRGLRPMFSRAA